jgi:predicted transcriptional regulator of viral defense system
MKSKINLLEQLRPLPYFGKDVVCQLGMQLGLKAVTVDTYISRFLSSREIIQLKKGLYVSADFFEKNKSDISYSFYLANVIRKPSYVSSWAALQYYNLVTEAIHSITSITTRVTRDYKTKAGNFAYQSIKKELFTDFSLEKGKFDYFMALPSKALFDLLYFRTRQFRGLTSKEIKALPGELRIDIEEMDKKERVNFDKMIENYLHHE